MSHSGMIPAEGVASCPCSENAAAYLAEELDALDRQAFETHLASCPVCARELACIRRTLDVLRTARDVSVQRDLAPEILSRLNVSRHKAMRSFAFRHIYAAAAAMILLLGCVLGFWTVQRSLPVDGSGPVNASADRDTSSARRDALAWLCGAQAPDGSWNVEKWGGDKRFGVALSSLATLAILETGTISDEQTATVWKAADYLLKNQDVTGEFGPSFSGAPYNHGIATLALLRLFEVFRDERLRVPLDEAVDVILNRQTPEGGWGYWGESTREPNLSVTLWQIKALKRAVALGWNDAEPNVRHAVQWVSCVSDDRGMFGYRRAGDFPEGSDALTAMGASVVLNIPGRVLSPEGRERIAAKVHEAATDSDTSLDYYHAYFLTAAMESMQDDASAGKLVMVRQSLLDRQIISGPRCGSWDPDRRWGNVGGRIYATAMASMSL